MKNTKEQAIVEILKTGDKEASFVLNVVQNWHKNSAGKIKGLRNLITAGHSVRTGQFSIDTLMIDGVQAPWSVLSEWERRNA